jgi:hypothetical protein
LRLAATGNNSMDHAAHTTPGNNAAPVQALLESTNFCYASNRALEGRKLDVGKPGNATPSASTACTDTTLPPLPQSPVRI